MNISEKLTTIAQNEQKVYDAGKKSEYDKFWDSFQNNGNRTSYSYAFFSYTSTSGYSAWNDETFKPKYDLKPTSAGESMFRTLSVTNFKQLLIDLGISLDLSKVTTFSNGFAFSKVTHLGEIDLSSCVSLRESFRNCDVVTIDKLIIKSTADVTNIFLASYNLENLTIEGNISKSIDFKYQKKLTYESIISIINALSESSANQTVTFSKTAINNAFRINIDDETTYPEGSEFYDLRNSKSNWTFNYV